MLKSVKQKLNRETAARSSIRALAFPTDVNIDVTFRCNASCSFCYIKKRDLSGEGEINLYKVEHILSILSHHGVWHVNFFGGEPLVVNDLSRLIKVASHLDLNVTLVTNGLLLTDEFCSEVEGSLDAVGVSIHGRDERHDRILGVAGAFRDLMRRLPLLSKHGIEIGINYTIIEGCGDDFFYTSSYLLDRYPVKYLVANRFVGGRVKEQDVLTPSVKTLNQVLHALECLESDFPGVIFTFGIYFPLCLVEKRPHRKFFKECGVGSRFCSVDFDGNMRICSFSGKVLGNILEEEPLDIWQFHEVFVDYRKGGWIPEPCLDCALLTSCLVGCRVSDPKRLFGPDALLYKYSLNPISGNELEGINNG